jgi:hypothetical protein
MGGGGVRRGNATTTWEGRDDRPESSVDTADGSLMVRYGATAPRRQWTAQRLLDGKVQRNGSSMAMAWTARRLLDGEGRRATAPRRRGTARVRRQWTESTTAMGSDGRRDGELTVMDGAALRQWTARRQLDGKGRRDGDSTTMDNKEGRERDGDVKMAGGGSNKGQRGIKL